MPRLNYSGCINLRCFKEGCFNGVHLSAIASMSRFENNLAQRPLVDPVLGLYNFFLLFLYIRIAFPHILKAKSNFTLLSYIPFLGIDEWYFKCV